MKARHGLKILGAETKNQDRWSISVDMNPKRRGAMVTAFVSNKDHYVKTDKWVLYSFRIPWAIFLVAFCFVLLYTIAKILRRKSDFFWKTKKRRFILTILFNTSLDTCHIPRLYYPKFRFYNFVINFKITFRKEILMKLLCFPSIAHVCGKKKTAM